jgi:aldehyde:ferredoxin oxidoreductase
MANGYTGKILRVNLTTKEISSLDTAKYEEFGGGYGMGTAIFWELSVAPGQSDLRDPYDPRNVLPLMVGPLAGTGVPGGGRTNVCGISPETFPTCEFHSGNFGGRFGAMLKAAGWDGVVVEGGADKPVWINIINDKVTVEDAKQLWGLDTWEVQERIVTMVAGRTRFGEEWQHIGSANTTARPQIVCIGQAGEVKSRLAALITGSGVSARKGGFGAVFGAKNLKAISVIGTGNVQMADPKGVLDARLWHMQNSQIVTGSFGPARPGSASCSVCMRGDRRRDSYSAGETMCVDQFWLDNPEKEVRATDADRDLASQALMRYGVSGWSAHFLGLFISDIPGAPDFFHKKVPVETGMGWYLRYLYEIGELGPGKRIDSAPLPMDQWGDLSFRRALLDAVSRRVGIGDALAEGCLRAAEKWGRLNQDLESGALRFPAWGATGHWTLPAVEWAYNYLLGAGDPCWHGLVQSVGPPRDGTSIEQHLGKLSTKLIPYDGDIMMLNYAWKGEEAWKTGIYSPHKAKEVAWSRHYASFWNESMAFCEMFLPELTQNSPEIEMKYYTAVTGSKNSFADTMRIGQKIWTMERSIRTMQGLSREQEKFAPFMCRPGAGCMTFFGGVPIYENGAWHEDAAPDMYLDEKGVEDFKTHFYALEGWDTAHGWPTRKTLEGFGLKHVADTMAAKGRLGA